MSLFNRPAWAKSTQTTELANDEPDANIFSHSGRAFREIVAEQERKKQAKLDRKKEKEERRLSRKRDSGGQADGEAAPAAAASKRMRISPPEDDDDDDYMPVDGGVAASPRRDRYNGSVDGLRREEGVVRRSPRGKQRYAVAGDGTPSRRDRPNIQVVDLGSSDGEDHEDIFQPQIPLNEPVEEDSDDEFAALARRARQQRQLKDDLGQDKALGQSHTTRASPAVGPALDTGQARQTTPPPDPTIQLLVSSTLEGTKPMLVYRKLSQNIGAVRKIWCERQGFSEEAAKDVFFVHRMRRVYDVTTCRSLGLEVDSFGNLTFKGGEGEEDVDKVHLEAVTEETFRQKKLEKAEDSQKRNGESSAHAEDEAELQSTEPAKEEFIRLLLKAKGEEDFKLKVKASTTFARIIAAYIKTHAALEGQQLSLEFDGDKLNPDDEVQSTEVADLDCLQVHISSA